MKELDINFVANADKSGDNRFIQIKKEKDVALYRREKMDGSLKGFEVFSFKTIQTGALLPGGNVVQETYQSYPGGKSFGKTAWYISGENAADRAHEMFDSLVKGKVQVEPETDETEETEEIVPVVKVSTTPMKDGLKFPEKPFTQKELAAFNGFDNYKVVYSDLMKGLNSGKLRVFGERPAPRGKPARLFQVVV
jgi:predicted DCC family thiol-disulfide oxidoreductase YuxK